MTSLTDRLLHQLLQSRGSERTIAGIVVDPVAALQLERERAELDAEPASPGGETFAGYPMRSSPREGAWVLLDPLSDDDADTAIRVW